MIRESDGNGNDRTEIERGSVCEMHYVYSKKPVAWKHYTEFVMARNVFKILENIDKNLPCF